MSTIYVMVGIPGSGKSTIAEEIAVENKAKIVSSDKIRHDLYGSEETQGNPAVVFDVAYNSIAAEVNSERDVIFDATNISKRNRQTIMKRFPFARKVAVFVATPLDTCKERNSNRERKVPEHVIDRMWKNLEPPTVEEGFNIVEIRC